jgi:hypothetical protein
MVTQMTSFTPIDENATHKQRPVWLAYAVLVLIKLAAIWFYYVPPLNLIGKFALLITFGWFLLKIIRGFKNKSWALYVAGAVLAYSFLFLPDLNDVRIVGLRYRVELEARQLLGLQDGSDKRVLLSSMGEEVYLSKGVIPNAVLFIPIKSVDGCYSEMTQISSNRYINYEVCPSGSGELPISISIF